MEYQLQFGELLPYVPQLANGFWVTVWLTAVTTLTGCALGILGAAARSSRQAWLRRVSGAYVEVFRNTPFIVQLFFIFFGLPALGVKLSAVEAGLLALVINLGAYSTEIIRAGIQATPTGQLEAARTLGLSKVQTFVRVVLPPALERIYPTLSSQCIIVMLGSAVVSQISVEDLTFAANFIQSRNFRSFEVYLVTALMYLLLAIGMRQGFRLVGYYAFPKRRTR